MNKPHTNKNKQDKNDFLFKNRIIYFREPNITDDYEYFENGVETYRLFQYDYKITTYAQLLYHISVIRWLNQEIDYDLFLQVCDFITATWSIYNEVDYDYVNAIFIECSKPTPIMKKVIFKTNCKLTKAEKIRISNRLTKNKGITAEIIEQTKMVLQRNGLKATQKNIASALDVSTKTIQRSLK